MITINGNPVDFMVILPHLLWAVLVGTTFAGMILLWWFQVATRKPEYWWSDVMYKYHRFKWGWCLKESSWCKGDDRSNDKLCSVISHWVLFEGCLGIILAILISAAIDNDLMIPLSIIGLVITSPYIVRWVFDLCRGLKWNKKSGDLEAVDEINAKVRTLERRLEELKGSQRSH